ncbi:uncharacterized protein LOC122820676 [Gambusia affinis]|uniref:uncharacterized protein LOC122820676 n=1 Tax=Gambusia affinis TaxID=33528 RepID=UPI001CDCC6E9|nr:uncharacterized protein LOC122820676 [Gambusia affinis]
MLIFLVVVIRRPNWPQMFSGETITLTCEVQGGETTEWTCDWRIDGSFIHRTDSKDWTFSVSESNRGDYRCLCFPKDDWFSSTEWSEPISLSVLRKPKAHLSTDSIELPAGGNVILTCSLNTSPSSLVSLKYFWYRGEKSSEPVSSEDADFLSNGQMSVSEEGLYWCRGGRGEPVYYTDYSDHVNITKNLSVGSSGPVGSLLFVLLVVALLGGISLIILLLLFWRSKQKKDKSNTVYSLAGFKNSGTKRSPDPLEGALWSYVKTQAIELPVGPEVDTVYAKVKKGATELPVGPEVDTVYAKVKKGATDKFINTVYSQIEGKNAGRMKLPVDPEEGAVYANVKKGATDKSIDTVYSLIEMKTFGTMKDPHDPQEGAVGSDVKTEKKREETTVTNNIQYINTPMSLKSTHTFSQEAFSGANLIVDPNWSTFHPGESVTFICDISEGEETNWQYELRRNGKQFIQFNPHKSYTLQRIQIDHSGEYQCCGLRKSSKDTDCSDTVSLTVTAQPKAKLTAGPTTIPVGGSVTLRCSVEPSTGWKYRWFRRTQNTPEVEHTEEGNRDINVTQGGIYRCIGKRGNGDYPSVISDEVSFNITFSNKVVVTRRELITLTCEVQGGETTEWTCDWKKSDKPVKVGNDNHLTVSVNEFSSGNYMCRCRRRDDWYSVTKWSEKIPVSVSVSSPVSSSFLVLLIVGSISGIVLLVLLLLLWRYKRSNDLCCVRSQSSATNHGVDQTEGHLYSSLLHGTTSLYETVHPRGATGNERRHHPEEGSVYVNVRPGHERRQ